MKYIYSLALLSISILIASCGNDVRDDSIGTDDNNIHHDIDEIEDEVDEVLDLGPINEDNKALYDALIPLNDQSLPKEMKLSDDGFKLLPLSFIGQDSGVEYTLFAEYRFKSKMDHAIIVRVESYASEEIEVFQNDTQYYIVALDEQWNVSDRKKIHAKNSAVAGKIVSSGWYEMENINVAWMKILLEEGKIVVVDEDTNSFDGSDEGSSEANQFRDGIHSKEWR